MAEAREAGDFQSRLQELDKLLQDAERVGDPAARARTRDIVRALLDLHAAGLERLLAHLRAAGSAGAAALDACVAEPAVAGMLLLHELHPLGLEARVEQALEDVRPFLRSHGGDVEVLGIEDGTVRLRLEGSCDGCPSSAQTMRETIEQSILCRAPDITSVEVEGVVEPVAEPAVERGLYALPVV
jgi:Fe-S cluster biogenesis protein NfuA